MTGLAAAGLASAIAAPADAELLGRKDLSLATSLAIATTAADLCKSQGYTVSVTVVGCAATTRHRIRSRIPSARPIRLAPTACRRANS
jgi:uncharacterized protein GlcG (DUF336 family)